jgi:hypothetical protein
MFGEEAQLGVQENDPAGPVTVVLELDTVPVKLVDGPLSGPVMAVGLLVPK